MSGVRSSGWCCPRTTEVTSGRPGRRRPVTLPHGAAGTARRCLPETAGHRARPAGDRARMDLRRRRCRGRRRDGGTGRDRRARTAGSTPSTATRWPATRSPRRRPPTARCWPSPRPGRTSGCPEPVDLAFCRFLLLHVVDPAVVVARMAGAVRPGGWVVAQEPITSAGRINGGPFSMPDGPAPRRRRPAARAGPPGRSDHRRCLGRGPGRRRSGAGGRLSQAGDRGRSGRRSGGAAATGDRGGPGSGA